MGYRSQTRTTAFVLSSAHSRRVVIPTERFARVEETPHFAFAVILCEAQDIHLVVAFAQYQPINPH
jgi:hypothetical protein